MKRKNVIVVTEYWSKKVRVYGNFKKMCEAEGLPYHSLKTKKFPFDCFYEDQLTIHKVEFN